MTKNNTLKIMADIHKAGAIIIKDKKVLMSRTRGKEIFVNPGGKLQERETAVQALIRELKEELSIAVEEKDLELFGTFFAPAAYDPEKQLEMDVFFVRAWTGEIVPNNEVEEIKWVDSSTRDTPLGSIFEHEVIPKLKAKNLID